MLYEEMEQRVQSLEKEVQVLNNLVAALIKLTGVQKDINSSLYTQIKIINKEITQK